MHDRLSPSAADADASRALLQKLARQPRFSGSTTEKEARNICADELRAQGFEVAEQPFTFSEFPGRWAPSLGAVVLAIIVLFASHMAVRHGAPTIALLILSIGLVALGAAGWWTARHGTAQIPWLRSQSANLIATRGSSSRERPAQWLVAHIDSKSQTIPMLARIASVVLSAAMVSLLVGAIAASALATEQQSMVQLQIVSLRTLMSPPMHLLIAILSYLAVASLIPMMLCIVGNKSPGALDNASGVAAVLMAVRQINPSRQIGVIITSGEELGLAGARAYADQNSRGGTALNCDTIDDRGGFICMVKGKRARSGLAQAVTRAAGTRGIPVRIHGLLPGVLADNIAFTDAGWDSLTLCRGNIATLARVHTAGDRPDGIDGSGIAEAAGLLAATIEELS